MFLIGNKTYKSMYLKALSFGQLVHSTKNQLFVVQVGFRGRLRLPLLVKMVCQCLQASSHVLSHGQCKFDYNI